MNTLSIDQQSLYAIAQLYVDVFQNEPWNETWEHSWALERLENIYNSPNFEGFYITKNEKVVAVVMGRGSNFQGNKEFEICEFYVQNTEQGSGIGKHLHEYLTTYLKEKNYQIITLLTSKDVPAIEFYKKRGYELSPEMCLMYQHLT